jgi:hypothetical protein
MACQRLFGGACRRAGAVLVMAALLGWAAALPLHARFEAADSAPAAERGHSDQCATLHREPVCHGVGPSPLPAVPPDQRQAASDSGSWLGPLLPVQPPRPTPFEVGAPAVRAPPTT